MGFTGDNCAAIPSQQRGFLGAGVLGSIPPQIREEGCAVQSSQQPPKTDVGITSLAVELRQLTKEEGYDGDQEA